jgi:hypothetical protein
MNKNYYVIAGYDLTGWVTDKYEDWKWSDDGEKYVYNQTENHIQLFDDAMNGEHLYLGFVLVSGDEHYFKTVKFDMEIVNQVQGYVKSELTKLIDLGVISKDPKFKPIYQVIVFEECL